MVTKNDEAFALLCYDDNIVKWKKLESTPKGASEEENKQTRQRGKVHLEEKRTLYVRRLES
jgi:hypothetical protein